MLLAILVLVIAVWVLVQTSFFQNFVVHKVAKRLSRNLNTTVSIKHVDVELFDKMLLQGLLVLDRKKDTLLYAGTARVSITDWFFFKDNIVLKYIGLDDAIINLKRTDSIWNYQFLVDYFSSPAKKKDTSKNVIHLDLKVINMNRIKIRQEDGWRGQNMIASINKGIIRADVFDMNKRIIQIGSIVLDKPSFAQYEYTGSRPRNAAKPAGKPASAGLQWNPKHWQVSVKSILLKNGAVAIVRQEKPERTGKRFDENHILLSELTGAARDFKLADDTITSHLTFSVKDRSGFYLKKASADFKFTPVIMELNQLDLQTEKSHLKNYFAMHYTSFLKDMQDFIHTVTIEGKFENSVLSSDDLAYFAPQAKDWNTVLLLNGTARGKIDNLTAKNIKIRAGKDNYVDGDISIRGLPEISETFIDFRARELRTSYNELARIIPSIRTINNPRLSTFGNIKFAGSYTGYVRDFVTFGTLSTDIGVLQTDLHLKIPEVGEAVYQGKISTKNFQLGKFIQNSQIGNIAFDGKIKGVGFNANKINLGIDGVISKLDFKNYTYKNIIAHGDFKNKLFNGRASIQDENIRIDTLVGKINFSRKDPTFNVNAMVNTLNLKNLGFTKDSISLTGNFNLDFTGNNIDNFLGSAELYNAVLIDNGKRLSFDSLIINSSFLNGSKLLTLATNELEASINGTFSIADLPEAFQLFLYRYYPAYINKPKRKIKNQDFTFLIKTNFVSDYINLFNKKISGLDNSIFIGNVNIAKNTLNVQADIPKFSFSNVSFNNIHFTGRGTADTLIFNGAIDDVVVNDSLHSPDTRIKIVAANDISDVSINASSIESFSALDLSARVQTKKEGFRLTFNPSSFTVNQKKWDIAADGELELNKKMLMGSNITFSQNGQQIVVSTTPSDIGNSNDVIVDVHNLIIEDFAPMVMKSPAVNGLLNGNVRINDPFGKLAVEFNTRIDKFKFEGDSIGVLTADGHYLSGSGNIQVNATSKNLLYDFVANFGYNPKDSLNALSGSVVFSNSEIHVLEKYLNSVFSNIYGTATGKLNISGKASDPKLTGSVSLDSTTLTVGYTRCRYILNNNSVITFNPDEIDFGTIKIKDTLNHTATLSGKIYHSFFDNFFFNELHLKTDPAGNTGGRFLLLNTTPRDNKEFYGKVIGEAELSLNGFLTDMRMNISGEPTDSSHIFLPTGETAETGSLNYIEFIKFGREMRPDLRTNRGTNIKVNMELTANPLAKIDVILDAATGDVIRANGSGKLNITAGTRDPLTIRGRYDVEEGEYTFNFQTFLQTPFNLQQGYIEWQGDPYLANLNIDAIYRAENVNLNNIPTSVGFRNVTGDVDIIFKLRGTLKDPRPEFEFQFPFDNPLKSDPIANEFLKTRYEADKNALMNQVTSLLLFNQFMSTDQSLLTGNNTGNFVTRSVGQLLSATLTSSLNSWLQKILNTNSVNLITNINTSDFNFQKGVTQREIQNVGNFGVKTAFLNNKLLVTVGGNVDYRLGQTVSNSNSNFLFTPDVSFEYLITPEGRLRVIGFNRSDAEAGDISGVTRRNRTGIQLSYRKDFNSFSEFFTNENKRRNRIRPKY